MKNKLFITIALLILSALPAIAEVWDSPHKYFDKKTNKWVVYIPSSATIKVSKEKTTDIVYNANECGWITFPVGVGDRQATSIKTGFELVERLGKETTIPARPKCIKQKDGTYKTDYNVSPGTLLKSPQSYHFLLEPGNPAERVEITRRVPLYRKGTQCGFILFGVSDKRKLTKFTVDGVEYNFDDLTVVKHPRICYKGKDGEWVLYTPDNF